MPDTWMDLSYPPEDFYFLGFNFDYLNNFICWCWGALKLIAYLSHMQLTAPSNNKNFSLHELLDDVFTHRFMSWARHWSHPDWRRRPVARGHHCMDLYDWNKINRIRNMADDSHMHIWILHNIRDVLRTMQIFWLYTVFETHVLYCIYTV